MSDIDLSKLTTEEGIEVAPGVRVRLRSLADYRQNPENPVSHTPRNLGSVVSSIGKVGAGRSGLSSKGKIVAGNLTWEAMAEAGIEGVVEVTTDGTRWVMVNREDLTPEQEKQAAYGDQQGSFLAGWEFEQMLADAEAGFDFESLYIDVEDILGDAFVEVETGEAPEPQIDKGAELAEHYGVEVGQVWSLGLHRLACGDCRDSIVLEALIQDDEISLSHHDPPYGANVVKIKGQSGRGSIGGGNWGPVGEYPPVAGDEEPFDPSHLLNSGKIVILWGANYYADKLPPSSCWLVWDKREGTSSNNFADCELAWVSVPGPARLFAHRWMGMIKASEQGEKRLHPTQKPIALFEWVLEMFTNPGDIVADWYCGVGGQLLAGERLNRPMRACELIPEYVALTIQRWEDATGERAVLLTD